jgi:exonuclease III
MGTEKDLVRVATFNLNNINKRLDNLLAWLSKAQPEVVSLQELKAEQEAFPLNALRTLGYEAVWQGEHSWNGVAILARNHVPVLTCTSLPGNPENHQARYIEAAVQGVLIASIYLPNGNRARYAVGLAQTAVIQAMPDSSSIALSASWHFHGLIEVGERVKNASGKKSLRGLCSAT